MPDKVDQLYDALKADGAVKNSRENFRGFMFAPGKQGYNNRLQLYKSLRADGAIKSKSYEEFRDKLGIGAVNPQRKQQASAAIGGTASQATQPVQNNMTNWANPGDATDMRSEWEKQQKPKEQKPNIATETQKAVRGEGEGAKRLRAATQQLKDRADYQKETGKELKSQVDLTSVGVTPTLARDEQGAVMKDASGNPLIGYEADSTKANVQRQEDEKKRLKEQLEEAYAEREKLDAEIEEGRASAANRLLGGMLPGNQVKSGYDESDMEQSSLLSAKRLLDRRITALEAANNNSGFWGGTKDQLKDPTSWSFGLSDAEDALVMANLKKKLDAAGGDTSKLTEGERLLADNYLKNQEAQKLNEDRDWWYKAGQGFGQSLSFMKDFALSGGGFANIAKAGMRYGAKKGAQLASKTLGNYMTKNLGTKALGKTIETIGKGAGLVAGTEAGGLLLNNTVQAASSAADIINKNTGNLTYDKDGNLTFEGGQSLGKAILTSQLSRTGENASELFGLAFDAVPGILGKVIQRTTPGKVLKNIANNKVWKAGEKGLDYLGVQSVWGEGMEEEYGMLRTEILNTLTNGKYEPNGSGILDLDRQLDTWATVGLTSMLLRVPTMIASGWSAANYYANKYNLNSSDKNMRNTFGNDERYNVVKTAIDEAENNQLAGVLSNLMTKSDLTDDEKQAMFTYANDLVKMRGFNIGNVVAAANGYKEPPRVSNYNIRGLHVDEVDKDGNVINSYDYDNADDLKTGLYEMQQNRADQTLQSDLMVMKARPNDQYQAFVDSYCEQFGIEPQELEEMLAKPSMERTEAEQSIVAPFADSLHNVVYDNSVLHEEQSQQDGEDLADILSLDLSNLNEEQALEAQKLTDEYKEAENALQELYKSGENGENIKEEIENMAGQPAQSIVSSLETFSPKSVDTVIGYYNAKAKLDGFVNRMSQKIDEEAANRRERHTFTGTINGQEDKTNIVNISDGTNTYTLVSGNVTTDGDGRITGSDTGLIIALDENGDFVQLSDTSGYGIVPSDMTLDQYQTQQEEELQLQMTSAIDPEGKLMEEQAEATAGGENTGANGTEASPSGTALERIPKDEQGNPIYEQGTPEDTYDALTEQVGESAQILIKNQLDAAKKRYEKLVKDKEAGKLKGKTLQEQIAEIKELQDKIDAEDALVKFWTKVMTVPNNRRADEEANVQPAVEETPQTGETVNETNEESAPDWSVDKASDARARGYRMENGYRVDRQQPITEKVEGNDTEVKFDKAEEPVKGKITVVEGGTLIPSHVNGQRNVMFFIDEAQPKERTDVDSEASSNRIAEKVNPEEITGGVTAYTGSPVVNSRGEVIQGNNRTIGMQKMWNNAAYEESQKKYKQYLIDHAAEFGLDPKQIEKMNAPVMVRMVDVSDDEAIRLGQKTAANTESGGKERIDPQRVIQQMGDNFRVFTNQLFSGEIEDQTLLSIIAENGVKVLKWLNDGTNHPKYITDTQFQSCFDNKGNLTEEAKTDLRRIVENMLFVDAPERLADMFYKMPAKAQNAILSTIWRDSQSEKNDRIIKDIQSSIEAFTVINGASEEFRGAKDVNTARAAVKDLQKQTQMFGDTETVLEKFSNFALELAIRYKGDKQNSIRAYFNNYYDAVQGKGGSLFESATKKAKEQAINEIFGIDINENENGTEGSNTVESDTGNGTEREPVSEGEPAVGEPVEEGEQPTVSGGRTETNGEVSEREKFISEHPLSVEQIDASDAPTMRKSLAKKYLDGSDESELAKAAYTSVYNKISAQPVQQEESTPEAPSTQNNATLEAQAKVNAILARMKKNKKPQGETDAYSIQNLTPEQIDDMLDLVEAGAELGYSILGVVNSKTEWMNQMRGMIGEQLKDATGYTDQEVDELLNDLWNAPYAVSGVEKTVGEWADEEGINTEDNGTEEVNGNATQGDVPGSDVVGGSTETGMGEETENEGGDTGTNREEGVGNNVQGRNEEAGTGKPSNGTGQRTGSTGKTGSSTGRGRTNSGANGGRGTNAEGGTAATGEQPSVPAAGESSVGQPQRVELTDLSKEKTPYKPASIGGKYAIGSVIPSGIADAIANAFKHLKEIFKKKSVLDIVREELGYKTNEEMLSDFDSGKTDGLAAEQVDAVALAIGKMKEGKSFIVGDMTGVGKGRTAAALIRWGLQHKKKVLFVTEKSGLFSDMYRDLTDIGCDYLPFVTNNDSEANITDSDGVKVVPKPQPQAQNALWQSEEDKLPTNKKGRQYDFVMTTYSQASNPVGANGKNKLEWLKRYAKDAIVIMDESHNASGESNRGEFFKELVKNAGGVTFLSATYAKRPDNMLLYAMRSSMSELHMAVGDMLQAIKDYGVAMQELMASALFGNGEMIRRERDMSDVKTTWTEPKEVYSEEEYEQCRKTSDKTMELVNDIIQFQRDYVNPIVKNHEDGFKDQNEKNALIGAPQTHATNTSYKSQVSNVVGLMVYAMKARKAAQMAIDQIKHGKRPVIAVENTLDSYIKELDGEIKDATFGPVFDKGVRFSLKYTIAQYEMKNGKASKIEGSEQVFDAESELDEDGARALANLRQRILDYIDDKDKVDLSLSPIDLIKQMIADAGYNCGEITGRSSQLEKRGDVYVKTPFRTKKKDAARKFNGGSSSSPLPESEQYHALVVNVAGATGISLHSSKKFGNQNPRTMIILQPARDVNTEVQMRGRIDRTGQVHRGEYFYLTSPIPAEQKMTMMLKQKLASLDAQSVGTKNVSSNKVESQDMDNKYGDEVCYQFLLEHLQDINAFLEDGLKYNNKTREWEGRPGLLYDVLKNLQRLPCDMQEMVINELSERYADQIDYLNQNGINDLETTTMNLEAVTIDKATFVKGKDNESTNEFAHDTSIERVEVNVLKKPMRSSDIKKKMKELGSLDEDGLPKEGVLEDVENKVREVTENLLKTREEKYKEQEEKLEEKIRKDHPQKDGMEDDVYENMITNWPTLAEMRQKHKADLASYASSLQEQFNKIYRAAMYLRPGRPYLVPLTDDIGNDAALMYGRFIGFQLKNGDPRQVQAVFAVKDSRSMITVPVVNKSNVIDRILRERNDMEIVALQKDEYHEELPMEDKAKKWDEWWDKMIPKNTSRQIRFMITGNVLQACGSLGKYKGQIVTFTRKNKDTGEITVERGMLLAENFDPENFKVRREVTKKDIWDNYGETKDERSGISCRREGSRMVVKFEKRKGEKLSDHPAQKDEVLKGLAMNGEIRPSGKTAILCVINEDNVEKALEHLYKEYGYTKEELFIMPDSTEKPDAIVPSNRPYQEVIDELSPKYGSEWTVESKIRKMLKRYKMDVNNESLVNEIKEAVTLRQAYLRKRYASGESNRLAWQVLIEDQLIERYKDDKEDREYHMRIREAILEELAFRGFKGNAYHYTQGKISTDDVRKMFDTMNDTSTSEGKAKKTLFDKVMEKVSKLPMEIFLSEKIDNDTGGWAGGRVINYNWKYMNADYISDQAKADTILHELIHTVTAYADHCVENGLEHLLDQDMIDAINELHSIFEAIKNDDTFIHDGARAYGLTNVREMLSEAGSNSEFREDLKKTNLWARLKAGFLAFFGIKQNVSGGKQVNAYEQIMERLEYLIENFKQEAWDEYYRGSQFGGYGYRKMDAQRIDTNDPMQAIEQASEGWRESSETIFNAAKKLFGTTTDVREAGYVLPDGTMLDFSGRHLMDEGSDTSGLKGRRTTDHRDISSIAYEKDGWTETGIETDMPDFIKRGAIRIDDNAGVINLAVNPTDEQLAIIRKIVSRNDGEVQVDFGDGWDSEGYIEYEEGTKPQRVLADINRFFERRERRIKEAAKGAEESRINTTNPLEAINFAAQSFRDSQKEQKERPEVIARHIYDIPRRHGLNGAAITQVINSRSELEQLKGKVSDSAYSLIEDSYNKQGVSGVYLSGSDIVVVFSKKANNRKMGEITWWHEQTHGFWHSLSPQQMNVYGKACLDYLRVHFPDKYDLVTKYWPSQWNTEGCSFFVESIIEKYGADTFMSVDFAGDENLCNFANGLREYLKGDKNGKQEKTNARLRQSTGDERRVQASGRSDLSRRNNEPKWNREGTEGEINYRIADPMKAIRLSANRWKRSVAEEADENPAAHSAKAVYEDRLNRVETVFSEAYQDSMISLKVGQNAIAKDKDIPDSQNAYMAENLMHGKNKNEQDLFNIMFRDPLINTINRIMDLTGMNWGDVDRYVYTKSGLERNREFYVRDWLEANKDKDGVNDIRDKWLALKEKAEDIDDTYTFADYLDELTDFIKKNINAKYDPSKHDYSGFRAMFGENYDESEIIDDLMNTETEIGDDVNTLWEQINACTKYGLDRYKEAGLKSEEQIENVKKMFHWYVPMRGFKEDTGEDMYQYFTGKGSTKNYVGGLLKHAKGRGSEASYPISTIFAMTYKAIADCNQNLVNQKFYRLCQANKNDLVVLSDSWVKLNENTGEWEEVWPQITDDMSEEEIRQATIDFEKEMNGLADVDKAKKIKGKPNFAYKPIDKNKKNEHVVEVWMNGQKKLATVVGNPRMAQALNGQLRFEKGHNIFSKWNADIKNFMSSLFTSYSPTFALRNMLRDWTHFRTMLIVREGEGYAHAAGKYYAQQMPKMISLFKKYREGTLGDSEMERDFKDFMDNGGITGFVQMNKIDEIQKEMEKLHKQMKDGKVIKLNNKLWDITLGAVEAVNEAIENNARFATYRASRHYANRTKARSAYDAKEITVNFNRKGAGSKTAGFKGSSRVEHAAQLAGITSQILGEGRIFFNATIQAIATTFKNFQNPDGSLNKPYIAKWAAKYAAPPFLFGLALPFINQMLAAALGGDDDDDPYANLPEWTRRKNLCFYAGKWDGHDYFITIPVGQELAAFLSLGDMFAGYTYAPNLKPVDRSFTEDMTGIMNTFSPIDVDTKITKGGITRNTMSEITGRTFSVLAPLVAVEQNLSWTGREIYREDVFENDYRKPEYQMVYSGTNPVLVGASKILHELGGGDDITRGNLEVNPAIVQYLWEQYTGGPGKVFSNTISIGKDAKDILQGKEADFNIRKVEGLKAFVQQSDDRTEYYRVKAKYRKYKEDADKLYNDIKGYKSLASEDPTAKMKLDRLMQGEEYARMKIAREAEKHLAKMRKSADALEGAEKKKRMKEYNKLVKEVVDRLDDVQ